MIRKTVAIDIGSTNSQMARIFEKRQNLEDAWKPIPNAEGKTIEFFVDSDRKTSTVNFPSVILRKCDLTENQLQSNLVENEYIFGAEAKDISRKLYGGAKVISGFKKDFYSAVKDSDVDSDKSIHKAAMESIGLYLKFFRELETKALQNSECGEERLILTVPVRATGGEREEMIELAQSAGWKNIEISDEATSALRYFLSLPESPLKMELSKNTPHQNLKILLMDLGGLTTDILVAELSPDGKGSFSDPKILGEWPEIGTKNTLGGIDVDRRIHDWLLENEYLIPQAVESYVERHGYSAFSEFKEYYINEKLRDDNPVMELIGEVANLMKIDGEWGKQTLYSKKYYNAADAKKIDLTVYYNEIVKGYFTDLQNAVRELLAYCETSEEEIDFICLSGGGTNLLGLRQFLFGELQSIESPLNFKKIKENPSFLLSAKTSKHMEPSAVCVAGALASLPYINFRFFCPYDWYMTVKLYKGQAGEMNGYDRVLDTVETDFLSKFELVYKKEVLLAKEKQQIPLRAYTEDKAVLKRDNKETFVYAIFLYSKNGLGQKILQIAKTSYALRTPIQAFKDWREKVKSHRGTEKGSEENCTVSYNIEVVMNESRCITIYPQFKGNGIWGFDGGKTKRQG